MDRLVPGILTVGNQQLLLSTLSHALILGGVKSRSSKSPSGMKPCSLELSRPSFLLPFAFFRCPSHVCSPPHRDV